MTALADEVTALQTTLAGAATSADVDTLTAALDKVKTDLAYLLAANNVYTPADSTNGLVINSASSLTVAEALGDRIAIVNGKVTITNTAAAAMDQTKLQAVVDKMVTITDRLSYTHSGSSVSGVVFNNLTGTGDLTLDQEAAISLPKLVSAANVTFTDDIKVTSISAPELTKVTSLATIAATQATSISLPKFKGETGDAILSITAKSKSTIDLSSYDTLDETSGLEVDHTLTINGPSSVTLPLFVTGSLTTDAEVLTLVGAKEAPSTDATKLKEIHLHNYQTGDISFGVTYAKLSIVDIIGTYETKGIAATVAGPRTNDVTIGTAGLETLTLAGALGDVTITNASSLTSVTTSGGMTLFSLDGATDLDTLTLGHGANASSTLKRSDLSVTGATSLTSLTADSVNYVSALTIEDNTSLATISLAGLAAISTETADEVVSIRNNNFVAQSFQLPSEVDTTPVVAGKITSDSGLGSLQAYLDKAVAATDAVVYVEYDDVLKATDAAGLVYEVGSVNGTSKSVEYADGDTVSVDTAADTAFVAVDVYGGVAETYNAAVYQTNTMVITNPSVAKITDSTVFSFDANGEGESVLTVTTNSAFQAGITDFDANEIETYLPEVADALQAKITAAGYDYTIDAYNDYGATAAYSLSLLSTSGLADNDVLSASGVIFVKVGNASFVTATVSSTINVSSTALAEAVVRAINEGALSNTFTATNSNNVVTLTKQTSATNTAQDLDYVAYPDMTFGGYTTDTETSAIPMSYTARQVKAITKGWRVTAVNTNVTVNAQNLEADQFFFSETAGGDNFSVTAVGDAGQYAQSTATLQIPFSEATVRTERGTGVDSRTTDFTAWM